MTDLAPILTLWHELETAGTDYVLATIVAVQGSSYRKTGTHMLLAQDGRRSGTVSGGCLEAEVARRAWWLTASGSVVERYSTIEDDGDRPYGSGCGGVVFLLLERPQTARRLLAALEQAFQGRVPLAVATIVEGPRMGTRVIADALENQATGTDPADGILDELQGFAQTALEAHSSCDEMIEVNGAPVRVRVDYQPARPGLWIFTAGDDAKPLVALAQELGWFTAIADGRSHLATRERFPAADQVQVLPIYNLPDAAPQHFALRPTDAAIVMTHSFDQDSRILASLLGLGFPLAYLGVLGPQRRTRELLAEAARLLHLPDTTYHTERWLEQLHAPTGLDLGADSPATIALSILAEVQKALTAATGQPLRQVRAAKEIVIQC